jgi:hypothetical protein
MAYDGQKLPVNLAEADRTQQDVVRYVQATCLTMEDRWKNHHVKFVAYMDVEKKRPSEKSKDPVIKMLGKWGSKQVENYDPDKTKSKKCMKTPKIHAIWTTTLHDYSKYF